MRVFNPSLPHTACKNCSFAIYEGKTQTGCTLGRIDKFKERNTEILEAYDNDKEFYIVNGKYCLTYRSEFWYKEAVEPIKQVRQEINTPYLAIVFGDELDEIGKTLQFLQDLPIKPTEVSVVRRADAKFSAESLLKLMQQYSFDKWFARNIMEVCIDTKIIDDIVSVVKLPFYLVTYGNCKFDFITPIDKLLNDELCEFSMVDLNEYTFLFTGDYFVTTAIHRYFGGNSNGWLYPKILEDKQWQKTILRYSDVLTLLKK